MGGLRTNTLRRSTLALALLAALAAPGCGGDDGDDSGGGNQETGGGNGGVAEAPPASSGGASDEAQIRETVAAYVKAFAAGDGAAACAQLSANGKRASTRSYGGSAGDDCERVISGIARFLDAPERERLRRVRPGDIAANVSGGTATAEIRGAPGRAKLVRSDGRWLIDDFDQSARGGGNTQPSPSQAPDPENVAFAEIERALAKALDRRYDSASFECPPTERLRRNQEIACTVRIEGEAGTMKVKLLPHSRVEYKIQSDGRHSYGQTGLEP